MYHSSLLPVADTPLRLWTVELSESRGLGIVAPQGAAAIRDGCYETITADDDGKQTKK